MLVDNNNKIRPDSKGFYYINKMTERWCKKYKPRTVYQGRG